jgi:hypothetical protein
MKFIFTNKLLAIVSDEVFFVRKSHHDVSLVQPSIQNLCKAECCYVWLQQFANRSINICDCQAFIQSESQASVLQAWRAYDGHLGAKSLNIWVSLLCIF